MTFMRAFPHAMLANEVMQLRIGNGHIRICNNHSEKHLTPNLIDRFCLTNVRPEYDSVKPPCESGSGFTGAERSSGFQSYFSFWVSEPFEGRLEEGKGRSRGNGPLHAESS